MIINNYMNQIKIGQFIAKMRKEKGLLQRELAAIIGVDRTTVNKWEKGILLPSTKCLIKLSIFFECSVDELLKG